MDSNSIENNKSSNGGVPLSTMKPGQHCKVVKITGRGGVFRRIMDIGIHVGTKILVERVAPLGDPVEFKLQGCHVSLRKEEAENILVEAILD